MPYNVASAVVADPYLFSLLREPTVRAGGEKSDFRKTVKKKKKDEEKNKSAQADAIHVFAL